jgi:hypothetical protein
VELAPFGHTYDDRLLTACGTDIKINTGLKINRPAGASAKKAHSLVVWPPARSFGQVVLIRLFIARSPAGLIREPDNPTWFRIHAKPIVWGVSTRFGSPDKIQCVAR